MLIGEFETKLTDNNRLALPKKFRSEVGDKLIVLNGYEGCLIVVDEKRFLALTKDIIQGRFTNDSVRDLSRFLIGTSHEIKLDKQGRFVLPQSLKVYSEIDSDTIFLGLLNWIEVWNKEKWLKRKEYLSQNSAIIAKNLEDSLGRETK
jgi:MraZ protein